MASNSVMQGSIQDHGQRDGRRSGHRHNGSHLQKGFCQGGGAGEHKKSWIDVNQKEQTVQTMHIRGEER